MSTQLTYNQALDLLPLYALGSLEPEEMLAMEEYLQEHQDLLLRLQAVEETIAQLAHSAPVSTLPVDARSTLLARVRADLESQATGDVASPATPSVREHNPLPMSPVPAATRRVPRPGWREGVGRWGVQLAGALAVLALLFALGQSQAQLSQLRADVVQLNERALAERRVLELLANAEQRVLVPGTALAPAARATFYRSGNEGVLVVQGLAPLPADKSYQLWLVVDGQPTPVGLLPEPQGDGPNVLIVPLQAALQDFAIVDVSIEQAGGSDTITKTAIVLRGAVEAAPQ